MFLYHRPPVIGLGAPFYNMLLVTGLLFVCHVAWLDVAGCNTLLQTNVCDPTITILPSKHVASDW
jgi:hypothetical protein